MTDRQAELLNNAAQLQQKPKALTTPDALNGKYRLVRRLGQGTQGNVYEAERLSDHARVAIKQLRIDSVTNWKAYDLFQRESEVLASLDMQGVAQFYESIEDLTNEKPAAYIVQQYIHGRSLDEMMKTGYRLTISRVFELALQLLNILEALHTHEPPVIHRDIKPSNILLQPKGGDEYELYLIDFGAVANPMVQAGGSTVAGTYGYMPPEQLVGRPIASSDLYAMGATLAYMLSGVEPGRMSVQDFRLVIDPHLENVPRAIITTLHQLLDPAPDKRICDYSQLRKRFTEFSQNRFVIDNMPALSEKETAKQLENIRRFNQPGCLELWMQLPENTPRTVGPNYVEFLSGLWSSCKPPTFKSFESAKTENRLPKGTIGKLLSSLLFLIVFSYLLLAAFNTYGLHVVFMAILYFTLCLLISFLEALNTIRKTYFSNDESNDRARLAVGELERKDEAHELVKKLMTHGKKAIATVVSCEYKSIRNSSNFKVIPQKDHYADLTTSLEPTFEVKYKFNPPDDDNPNDLFHVLLVHHDVTQDLVVGAPLPILYLTLPGVPGQPQKVVSIPYPLPNDSSFTLNDIIGGAAVSLASIWQSPKV